MRIVFLPTNCLPFHGKTLDERPLGGTETGVIRLAEALTAAGHDVFVVSQFDNPPLTEPLYIPLRAVFFLGEIDILIGVRDWQSIFSDIPAKRRYLWTGDSFDQPQTVGLGDKRIAHRLDGLLCVSEWHKKTMCQLSGFPQEKTFVIRNGITQSLFQNHERKNNPKRLIYSSTPYRGLIHLIDIFKGIRNRIPDAEFCVCSGYTVYQGAGEIPAQQLKELEVIQQELKKIDGVIWKGNILQRELAQEMLQSGIYAYPCIFAETSCISIMEAKVSGVVPVTNSLGALPETVGRGGVVLADAEKISPEIIQKFISSICELMLDEKQWSSLSEKARLEGMENTWDDVAQRVITYCQ